MNDVTLKEILLGPSPLAITGQVLAFSLLTLAMTYGEINQRRRHIVISSHGRIVAAAIAATLLNVTFYHLLMVAVPTQPVWLVIVTFVLVFSVGAAIWLILPVSFLVHAIAKTALNDTERPEGTLYRGDSSVIRRSASKVLRLLIVIGFFVALYPSLSK